MPEQILGLIPQEEWLDVGTNVNRPNDPLDALIGDERTDNIVARWQSIASEYQTSVMANFHGFDTEANKTFRVPVDTHSIEKGLIKVKLNQSERLRALVRSGVREEQLRDYVLEDGVRLADQVITRSKVAKAEMMATGKMTIHENNLDLTVDYGVPEDQLGLTLDLSESADVPGQLQDIVDKASDKGVTLTGIVTARRLITKLRQNKAIQGAINGSLMQGAMVNRAALNAYMEEEFGISTIITDDLTYGVDDGIGTDGRPIVKQKRYYPNDKISFFAANPGGRIGVGLWGDPPEADHTGFYPTATSSVSPFVYVTQKMEWDPAVLWTKASALFIPLLYNPNSLWVASATGIQTVAMGTNAAVSVADITAAGKKTSAK